MEFRDKLLSIEIRNITELVHTLSYELVILQDFFTEKFGVEFKRFRGAHVLVNEANPEYSFMQSNRDIRSTVNHIEKQGKRKVRKSNKSNDIPHPKYTNVVDADPQFEPLLHHTATKNAHRNNSLASNSNEFYCATPDDTIDLDLLSSQSDGEADAEHAPNSNQNNEDKITQKFEFDLFNNQEGEDLIFSSAEEESEEDWADEKCGNGNGKGSKLNVWKFFEWKRLPDGRKLVKCPKCHRKVSAVTKRMHQHRENCKANKSVEKLLKDENSDFHWSTATENNGRKSKANLVWSHFEKNALPDGQIIVTCNYCKIKVSNHVTRMARHLQKCKMNPIMNYSDQETQD